MEGHDDRHDRDLVLRVDRDGIAVVTLNDPDTFNCLTRRMIRRLHATLNEIAADPAVRVVILASTGRAFCAGHDPAEMRDDPSRGFQEQLFGECGALMRTIGTMPQPVIAQVQGMAAAAGCQLVATCDLAVAGATARFATSGIDLGLFCSTPAVALSRNIGRKRAFEMLATGEPMRAEEALRCGLINRVVAPEKLADEAEGLARRLAAKAPAAMKIGKALFRAQLDLGYDDALTLASAAMVENMMTSDAHDGFDRYLSRRAARS